MAKKVKDTDYLFISTYLHSRERDLLTAARMERMIEAPTAEEAAKVLAEIGYGEFNPSSERELSAVLASEQEKLFEDLYRFVPDKAVVDVFKVKYDYHNLKTLLKARAMGVDGGRLLLDAGRVSAQEMNRAVTEGDYNALPELLRAAAEEAGEVLASTGDPQLSDFVLDRAYYAEMLSAAEETGSAFLASYVRASIDAANLRSAVRTRSFASLTSEARNPTISNTGIPSLTSASMKTGMLRIPETIAVDTILYNVSLLFIPD